MGINVLESYGFHLVKNKRVLTVKTMTSSAYDKFLLELNVKKTFLYVSS